MCEDIYLKVDGQAFELFYTEIEQFCQFNIYSVELTLYKDDLRKSYLKNLSERVCQLSKLKEIVVKINDNRQTFKVLHHRNLNISNSSTNDVRVIRQGLRTLSLHSSAVLNLPKDKFEVKKLNEVDIRPKLSK